MTNQRGKRRFAIVASFVAVTLVVAPLLLMAICLDRSPTQAVVTPAAYESIQQGASRARVAEALGDPKGASDADFVRWLNNRSPRNGFGSDLLNGGSRLTNEYWYDDGGVVILAFDDNGRVVDRQFLYIDTPTGEQAYWRLLDYLSFSALY